MPTTAWEPLLYSITLDFMLSLLCVYIQSCIVLSLGALGEKRTQPLSSSYLKLFKSKINASFFLQEFYFHLKRNILRHGIFKGLRGEVICSTSRLTHQCIVPVLSQSISLKNFWETPATSYMIPNFPSIHCPSEHSGGNEYLIGPSLHLYQLILIILWIRDDRIRIDNYFEYMSSKCTLAASYSRCVLHGLNWNVP